MPAGPLLLLLLLPFAVANYHPCTSANNLDGSHQGNSAIILNNVTTVSSSCTVVASKTKPASMVAEFTAGLAAVEAFLGQWGPCMAFVMKAGATDDAEYAEVAVAEASFGKHLRVVEEAKAQNPAQNRGHALMLRIGQLPDAAIPGGGVCTCPVLKQHHVYSRVGVYSSSASYNWDQAVHEYVHVYQLVHAYTFTWMMEGGADHVTCLLVSKKPASYDPGGGPPRNYRDCIVSKLRESYDYFTKPAPADGKTILEKYADTYETVSAFDTDYGLSPGSAFHPVLYSGGLAATVFAIHKSSLTSKDYWIGTKSPWANNDVKAQVELPFNYQTTYPRTMPDTTGIRQALLAFTGYTRMETFFAEFDAWYRGLPDPAADYDAFGAAIKLILETDTAAASIADTARYADSPYAASVSKANIQSVFPDCSSSSSGGGGGGNSGSSSSSGSCVICPAVVPECNAGCKSCDVAPQTCQACSSAACKDAAAASSGASGGNKINLSRASGDRLPAAAAIIAAAVGGYSILAVVQRWQ
eukprot:g2457.t1